MPRHAVAVLLLSLVLSPTSHADDTPGRPITHEDVWLAKRIAAPVVSPDGRWLLLNVTEPAYEPEQQLSDLWLLPTDGSAPARRLTASRVGEANPAFSPDSRKIVFSSQREADTTTQIYELDLAAGGEAMPLTRIASGAKSPQYSPDGKQLLFVSTVFVGATDEASQARLAAERKARKYKARVYTGFPIRNWDKWLEPDQQLHLFVMPVDGSAPPKDLLAGSTLVQQPGFGGRFTETAEELDATWAPDSRSVVFSATINRDRGAFSFVHNDLFEVPISGGEPRRLTTGNGLDAGDSWTKPRFTPDGKRLLALVEPRTNRVFNAARLGWLQWPSRTLSARRLAGSEGRGVTSYAPTPDGRGVYFLAETDGLEVLWRGYFKRGAAERMGQQKGGVLTNLVAAERRTDGRPMLLANIDSASHLPEVARLDGEGGVRVLTAFNARTQRELDLPAAEALWTTAPNGKRIHSWLVKPAGFDPQRKYPLVVLLHGGPHGAWRDSFFLRWNYHLIAGEKYVLLLTNFSGSTGFGEGFAQSIQGDPFKGPSEEILAAAADAIARHPFIDGGRQCAGGASYGGHLANWLQGTTTHFRCLVSHAGLVNLESQWGSSDIVYGREANNGGPPWEGAAVWREQNPLRYAANFRTPTLVSIGELDFRVPLNNSIEYWSTLKRQQVESRLLVFPDENHWVLKGENSRFFYAELDAWLERWLSAP